MRIDYGRERARFRNVSLLAITGLIVTFAIFPLGRRVTADQGQQQDPRKGRPESAPTPLATPKLPVPNPDTLLQEAPPVMIDVAHAEIDEGSTIRIDTSLVNLNVRVIDRLNRPINDVRKDEFRVVENGVPQTIESVSIAEVPISYGLAIDTSGSLRNQLIQVIDAGKIIINNNKPGDETFLVRFVDSEKIETKQDFTSQQDLLIDALDDFYIDGGQTAVIDAVYLSAEHVAQYKKNNDPNDRRRRALIVVTDGEDRSSYYKEEQLFERLREDDVQIFVIGFVNELDAESGMIRKSPRDRAVSLLTRMATETGGRAFFPKSLSELPGIASEITRDMRTQFIVSYYPTNKEHDGTYRALKVSIIDPPGHEKRIAITRPGYTAVKTVAQPKGPATKPASITGPGRPRSSATKPPGL
jgi:Ca-activated chloride channel family protein